MEKNNIDYIVISKNVKDLKVSVKKQLNGQQNFFMEILQQNNKDMNKKFQTLLNNVSLKNEETKDLLNEILTTQPTVVVMEPEYNLMEIPVMEEPLNNFIMMDTIIEIEKVDVDTFNFSIEENLNDSLEIIETDTSEYRKFLFFKFKKR
jgi:hypothetical protein